MPNMAEWMDATKVGRETLPLLVNQDKVNGRTSRVSWGFIKALADILDRAGVDNAAKALRCCRRSRRAIPQGHQGPWVRCRRRYCPSCAMVKAWRDKARVRECLVEAVARGGAAAFLTLNPAMNPSMSLQDRITSLLADFARIRNRRAWRGSEGGYQARLGLVFGLEIGGENSLGHPHLHLLLWGQDSEWVESAARWLKNAWCQLNPGADPSLQWLDMVEPSWESLDKVSGYVTKGTRVSLAWPVLLITLVVEELSSGRRHIIRCGLALPRRGRNKMAATA